MIDLHFHCLPGIDDGPASLEEFPEHRAAIVGHYASNDLRSMIQVWMPQQVTHTPRHPCFVVPGSKGYAIESGEHQRGVTLLHVVSRRHRHVSRGKRETGMDEQLRQEGDRQYAGARRCACRQIVDELAILRRSATDASRGEKNVNASVASVPATNDPMAAVVNAAAPRP